MVPTSSLLQRFAISVRSRGGRGSLDANGINCGLPSRASSNCLQVRESVVRTTCGRRCSSCSTVLTTCGKVNSDSGGDAVFVINGQCCVGCGRGSGGALHRIGLCTSLVHSPRSSSMRASLKVIPTGVVRFGINICNSMTSCSLSHPCASVMLGVPTINCRTAITGRRHFGIRRTVGNSIRLGRGRRGGKRVRITIGANGFGQRGMACDNRARTCSCTCPFASCRRGARTRLASFLPCSLDLGSIYPSDIKRQLSALDLFRSGVPCAVRFRTGGLPSIGGIFLVNGGRCLYRGVRARVSISKLDGMLGKAFCQVRWWYWGSVYLSGVAPFSLTWLPGNCCVYDIVVCHSLFVARRRRLGTQVRTTGGSLDFFSLC